MFALVISSILSFRARAEAPSALPDEEFLER